MNGIDVDRQVADPETLIPKLGAQLVSRGHEIVEQGEGLLKTKRKGKLITADVTKMRLLVELTAIDGGLRFRFHTGMVASTWSDKDRAWVESEIDSLLTEVGA